MILGWMPSKSSIADRTRTAADPVFITLVCIAAWLVPGAGHLWQGRKQKGLVFLLALPLMFVVGLALHGRIFPFDFSEPLVGLAAIAEVGLGVPWVVARMSDAGAGLVTAWTYEYGNTFIIVAGLLNFLVIIDAFDIAMGRK